ncbi:MAG: hypothetical protein PHV23_04295 [Candidatus Gracilibacteria bacterium]|nr:hypothetical protein [Candidatus Gracilibacteria bacterium]
MKNKRFIELKKLPLIFSILFGIIFYLLFLKYFNLDSEISSQSLKDFYQKYTIYFPILFGFLSLVLFYILIFFKFIFRIKSYIGTVIVYFLSFGFLLFLGIDLMFFESRIADFANVIINTFSVPLIVSSSIILILVLVLSFKKEKLIK